MKLEKGKKYDVTTLTFTAWNNGDVDIPGYSAYDYFDQDIYLGADEDGIEPEFEEA